VFDSASEPTEQQLDDIQIRPVRPDDWHPLQLFHGGLSANTVRLRFHGAKRELSEPLAHRFTDLDGHDDVAFVATTGTSDRIVGVARYSKLNPTEAEVAFVVEDAYQHHGIGSRLMKMLADTARANGIEGFVADVLAGNAPMFHLLREIGPTDSHFEGSECEVRVSLLGDSRRGNTSHRLS
jgi:GNAT superfamily N-acetyltransferase